MELVIIVFLYFLNADNPNVVTPAPTVIEAQ